MIDQTSALIVNQKNCSLSFLSLILVTFLVFGSARQVAAVTPGQVDDFEDGGLANWANGAVQPINIGSGGPLGLNDNYLQVTSDGSGINGRLTIFNRSQWLGNYVVTGVNEIDLDLNNFGSTTLSIRLAFKSGAFSGASGYLTSTAFSLAPNSGWEHFSFSIAPATMTAFGTPGDFNTFFSNPAEFRIINEAGTGDLNGDLVTGQLGIDNIAAAAVPEPGVLTLVGLSVCGFCVYYKRRRRLRRSPLSKFAVTFERGYKPAGCRVSKPQV
jgi:hypothetical protein